MKFELPKLSYSYDALEPYIDARTMEIHHAKHHRAYVDKLNAALEKYPNLLEERREKREEMSEIAVLEEMLSDLGSLPEEIRAAVRNHGGGHYNHSLFWKTMEPGGGAKGPGQELGLAISSSFGDFTKFKEEFGKAAAGIFGSGWAWLALENREERIENKGGRKLLIVATANQDSPISQGLKPILGLDVWEHAYYLKYQNRRPEYIGAWWNTVNWEEVARQFEAQNP